MRLRKEKVRKCANCGRERPRDYHCINCNSVAREITIRFVITTAPTMEEYLSE